MLRIPERNGISSRPEFYSITKLVSRCALIAMIFILFELRFAHAFEYQ